MARNLLVFHSYGLKCADYETSRQDLMENCLQDSYRCDAQPHSCQAAYTIFSPQQECVQKRTYRGTPAGACYQRLSARIRLCRQFFPSRSDGALAFWRPCSRHSHAAPSLGMTLCSISQSRVLSNLYAQETMCHIEHMSLGRMRVYRRSVSSSNYARFGGRCNIWFGGRAILKDLPSAIRAMRGK